MTCFHFQFYFLKNFTFGRDFHSYKKEYEKDMDECTQILFLRHIYLNTS
jgi:hypothetical protein